MEKQSTESLVRRAMENDLDAWGELYEMVEEKVYYTALKVCRNPDDADDMLQDTFVTAMERIDQLEDPGKFCAWVTQIAANKSRDYLKKHKPMLFSGFGTEDEAWEPDWEDEREEVSPERVLDRTERRRLLWEMVGELPEKKKECIYLHYFCEFSVSDIAKIQGVGNNTVKSRLDGGRKKIEKKVLELEKKGTKLYGLAPIPFLVWLLKAEADATVVPATVDTAVAGAIASAATGTAGGSEAAATGAAASGAVVSTASGAGVGATAVGVKAILSTTVAKILAGVAAVGIISGGIAVTHERAEAPQEPTDGIVWSYDDASKTLTVSGSGPMPDYTAEGSVDDLGGGAVCSYPWSECAQEIESVVIEEGVTGIGSNAFRDCQNLVRVAIPDSVVEIGDYAFFLCTNLTELKIPSGVTSIGSYAFWNCTALGPSVTLPDGVSRIGAYAFARCMSLTEIAIPNGVTELADGTFYYCLELVKATIPDSVNFIGDTVFASCENLVEARIPDGVTHIGALAFMGCRNLTGITIPEGVIYIGEYAFSGCTMPDGSELPGSAM